MREAIGYTASPFVFYVRSEEIAFAFLRHRISFLTIAKLEKSLAPLGIDVNDSPLHTSKKARLSQKILFHITVKIKMIT